MELGITRGAGEWAIWGIWVRRWNQGVIRNDGGGTQGSVGEQSSEDKDYENRRQDEVQFGEKQRMASVERIRKSRHESAAASQGEVPP
jgi:hypothetical protein